jgi:tRNA G10  N-methylase Trm11
MVEDKTTGVEELVEDILCSLGRAIKDGEHSCFLYDKSSVSGERAERLESIFTLLGFTVDKRDYSGHPFLDPADDSDRAVWLRW